MSFESKADSMLESAPRARVLHKSRQQSSLPPNGVILHFDTKDLLPTKEISNEQYFVIAVEQNSDYRNIVPIRTKDEAKIVVKQIINNIHSETSRDVNQVQSDHGTEFDNQELRQWLAEKGINFKTSCTYTPEQNGTAGRAIRTIDNSARTMLKDSGLPDKFWPEAVKCACFARNRVLSPSDPTKTPYELHYGSIPDLANLKQFGQWAVMKVEPKPGLWSHRGTLVKFVAYTDKLNSFRAYSDEKGTVIETCNLKFLPTDSVPEEQPQEQSSSIMIE